MVQDDGRSFQTDGGGGGGVCSRQRRLKPVAAEGNSVFGAPVHSVPRVAALTSSMCESNQTSQQLSGVRFTASWAASMARIVAQKDHTVCIPSLMG